MKRLSDYKDEAAIELWGDLIQPITAILAKGTVKKALSAEDRTIASVAGAILKENSKEMMQILLRIDDTPITGCNLLPRTIAIITELTQSEEFSSFFKSAEQESAANVSTGSATESTEGAKQ